MQDFHHPFYDTFDCLWSLNNIPKVTEYVHVITDVRDRRVVDEVIAEFTSTVVPRRGELRAGVYILRPPPPPPPPSSSSSSSSSSSPWYNHTSWLCVKHQLTYSSSSIALTTTKVVKLFLTRRRCALTINFILTELYANLLFYFVFINIYIYIYKTDIKLIKSK